MTHFYAFFAINTFLFYRKKGKYMFYLSGLINLRKLNLSNCSFIFKESYFYDENNFNADIKIFSAMTNLTSLDLWPHGPGVSHTVHVLIGIFVCVAGLSVTWVVARVECA